MYVCVHLNMPVLYLLPDHRRQLFVSLFFGMYTSGADLIRVMFLLHGARVLVLIVLKSDAAVLSPVALAFADLGCWIAFTVIGCFLFQLFAVLRVCAEA